MLSELNENNSKTNKRFLQKNIKKLCSKDYGEILNIIKNNNEKYTENIRGVYFNLNYINDFTINKLVEFVKLTNAANLNEYNNSSIDTSESNLINEYKNYSDNLKDISYDIRNLISDKVNKSQKFSFQNFLQKISVSNIKSFQKTEAIDYPCLKIEENNFQNTNNNLYKKCKKNQAYLKSYGTTALGEINTALINTLDFIDLENI
tara:strand:- start:26422 stop:27036 length:615 start_codon:yes stop_codon:yes gene_type:complete